MFKTVDKERFITLMALVVILSALLGLWWETTHSAKPELSPASVWSAVEHGALGLTVFLFLFTKFLWKWEILHHLGIVKYPNLAGRWEGVGKGGTFGTEYRVICTITQDAWTIDWDCDVKADPVKLDRITSRNKSIAVDFMTDLRSLYLYVIYRNEIDDPSDPAKHGADHHGACRLAVIGSENSKQELKGDYWTNKKTAGHTCTSGVFHLVRAQPS